MKKNHKIGAFLIFLIVFSFLLNNYFSLTLELDKQNYITLLIAYIVCVLTFLLTIFKKDYYIFEPYTLVGLLYLSIMILRPCSDIVNGNYYRYGIYVMTGCQKGTIIFIISFIAYTIAYNFKLKVNNKEIKDCERLPQKIENFESEYKKIKRVCLIIFFVGFFSALIYFKTANYNPLMILKNISQSSNTYLFDSQFKFLIQFEYLMIIPWIYIVKFDKSRFLKIITTFLMFGIFLIGGSRIIIVLCVLSYVILPYVTEKKQFPIKKAVALFMILLIACDIIAFLRIGVRTGKKVDFSDIKENVKITDVFDSDLTVYQAYYCIVEKMPQYVPYEYGKGIVGYSIAIFFPRFLFPQKSNWDNMARIIEMVMNETSKKSGLATINIGEFYLEFGILGCIICMFIFGVISKRLKRLYLNKNSKINELILYCVLFTFLMQIVCRGYLPVQIMCLLFIVLPYFIIKYILNRRKELS